MMNDDLTVIRTEHLSTRCTGYTLYTFSQPFRARRFKCDELRRSGVRNSAAVFRIRRGRFRTKTEQIAHFKCRYTGRPRQRAISTTWLKRSRAVHLWPINLLVSEGPY